MLTTMTFEELKRSASQDIAKALGAEWVTKENHVAKNNRGMLTGITFMPEGADGGPTIYAEDIYDMYQQAPSYDEMICQLTDSIRESMRMHAESADFFRDLTFENAKDKLAVRMIDKSLNRELLKSRVYKDCSGGLVLIADIEAFNGRAGISPELLEQLGADKDELFEAAIEAAEKNHPAILSDISAILYGVPANLLDEDASLDQGLLYTLTTGDDYLGAACIMYPGMLEKLHDMFGGDFYVLPSSIHEVLVTKSAGKDPRDLQATILSANSSVVSEDEILSNHLYICDGSELRIV